MNPPAISNPNMVAHTPNASLVVDACLPKSVAELLDPFRAATCSEPNIPLIQGNRKFAQKLNEHIEQLRKIPEIATYFNFVFAYSEGFSFVILPAKEVASVMPGHDVQNIAVFLPQIQQVILTEEAFTAQSYSLSGMLRHELRHAYWAAMQKYMANNLTYLSYNFSPTNEKQRSIVRKALEAGDKRVKKLQELLFKESKKSLLSQEEKKYLKNLREICKDIVDDYIYPLPINVGNLKYVKELATMKGRTVDQPDTETEVFGKLKVLAAIYEPTPQTIVGMLDPLRATIHAVNSAEKRLKSSAFNYNEKTYEFEREAYLYGDVPPPLIKELYPELYIYIQKLHRHIMQHPDPQAENVQPQQYQTGKQIAYATTDDAFSNSFAIQYMVSMKTQRNLIQQVEQFVRYERRFDSNKLSYALTHLIATGKLSKTEKADANRLLADLANRDGNDGLLACRYYHLAYKQGADFTFHDYIQCLENLTTANQFGEAKIICQKARAKYQRHYEQIPPQHTRSQELFQRAYLDELQTWHDYIHEQRK